MKTYQDFLENINNKESFIEQAILEFKCSDTYINGIDAQAYYRGDNTTILARTPYIFTEKGKVEDLTKANNKIPTNFLNYIVTQEASTLLSNGLQTNDDIKTGLGGNKFDILLMRLSLYALVDGVAWAYNYIDTSKKNAFQTDIWRGTEFIPLFDEQTSELKGGIRFYQLDVNKPTYIELYELDGMSKYVIGKDGEGKSVTNLLQEKKAYNIKIESDGIGERVIDEFNWSLLPIAPLYANEIKQSVFTKSFKAKNDLYDIILSDFGNNLEDSRDVYWVLKNYGGQDLGEFIEQYKKYKAIKVGMDGEATPQTIEIPYEARDTALKMIEASIYKESMALDTSTLTGSSINTTAIKASADALNKKVDKFEWEVQELCENIINLYLEHKGEKDKDYTINFIRSGLTNDTEIIDNLMKVRDEISDETFYKNLPFVENAEKEIQAVEQKDNRKFNIEE